MSQQSRIIWIFLIISALAAVNCQLEKKLVEMFNDDTSNEGDTPEKNRCLSIQADINACYSCYRCHDSVITRRPRDGFVKLNLTDSKCESEEFCCIDQSSQAVRSKSKCGELNPEGYPRSVRDSLRSVLPAEYPWRAWLYNSSQLLCAATYMNEDTKVLVTSASCVKDNMVGPLYVRFTRDGKPTQVTQKIKHPESDLMILQVSELPGVSWLLPCCLPDDSPPLFGTTCIAISDDDHFIYTAIPKPEVCASALKGAGGGARELCAVAPSTDYRPEPGSALMCPSLHTKTVKYQIYGIALETNAEGYTRYTNIHKVTDWVEDQVENLQPPVSNVYRPPNRGYNG
ncbi:uncharacterized protein LOC121725586 [Aricia agestis]|uniref:uncharacterized protein LOC121725586 n=1 Tax=Aricia agestis TaxID=91739 RepID=UPI001C204352|nr:uncharacterized protein LOC121725586 [Aricia agestis]